MQWPQRLILLIIVLAFFSSGAHYFNRLLGQYQNHQRQSSLETLKSALQEYYQDQIPPQYPKTGEDLEKLLVPLYLAQMPAFPRHNSYHYQSDGQSFALD